MEEAGGLGDYLPISFKAPSERDYVSFLWESFETNYANGKFQFAFLAYHMLLMSFVYFNIWQIKQAWPGSFEKSLVGFGRKIENELLNADLPGENWPRWSIGTLGPRANRQRVIEGSDQNARWTEPTSIQRADLTPAAWCRRGRSDRVGRIGNPTGR